MPRVLINTNSKKCSQALQNQSNQQMDHIQLIIYSPPNKNKKKLPRLILVFPPFHHPKLKPYRTNIYKSLKKLRYSYKEKNKITTLRGSVRGMQLQLLSNTVPIQWILE